MTEHQNGPKSGRAVEVLGSYNPKSKERVLNEDRIKHWISMGAQPSGTMHNMLISAGITKGKKINVLPKKTVPKPAATEETQAEPVTESVPEQASETAGEPAAAEVSTDK